MAFTRAVLLLFAGAAMFGMGAESAQAARVRANDVRISCENGRTYLIRPRAITVAGELVTGYLLSGPRRGTYVRLIPMSNGYRYAGRGIWLDGVRESGEMNYGPRGFVPCSVSTAI